MDILQIPDMSSSEENQELIHQMSDQIQRFVLSRPDLQERIIDFPKEEGYAPTAKQDAIFDIVREFLIWLKKQ